MNGYAIQSIRNLYAEQHGNRFYNTTARVIETKDFYVLQSFYTLVAAVRKSNKEPLNFGYWSQTTSKHQAEFFSQLLGIERIKACKAMAKFKSPKQNTLDAIRKSVRLQHGGDF